MNFMLFFTSLVTLLSFIAAMDGPRRGRGGRKARSKLPSITGKTGWEVYREIAPLNPAAKFKTISTYARESKDCSNLLWTAVNIRGLPGCLVAEIAAKSSDEQSLIQALEAAASEYNFFPAYNIYRMHPYLLNRIEIGLSAMADFVRVIRYEEELYKMVLVWKACKERRSLFAGMPWDILYQHIFPLLANPRVY